MASQTTFRRDLRLAEQTAIHNSDLIETMAEDKFLLLYDINVEVSEGSILVLHTALLPQGYGLK